MLTGEGCIDAQSGTGSDVHNTSVAGLTIYCDIFGYLLSCGINEYPYNPPRLDTVVYATATPTSPNVSIKEPRYAAWIISSTSLLYYIQLPVRVTIKRIAPKPSGTTGYLLRKDFNASSTRDDEFPTYYGSLPPDSTLTPVKIDVPVGGIFTYNTTYIWSGGASDDYPYINYHLNGPVITFWCKMQRLRSYSGRLHITTHCTGISPKQSCCFTLTSSHPPIHSDRGGISFGELTD